MDIREIQETPIWQLYEKGRNYLRLTNVYVDTDKNYRFYEGDQWNGVKLGDGVEPVCINFIKPIVKYKQAVIHDNLYDVVFESMNHSQSAFGETAKKCCEMLNGYMERLWEYDKMDDKLREVTKDAAINSEGIIYIHWDEKEGRPVHEVVKKNDIYYGNENDEDIQDQPYILIRKRMPVVNAVELALDFGMSKDKIEFIIGDNDTFEQSGEAAKQEVDDMVTVVYKLYKKDGTVHFAVATRWVTIAEDNDIGLTLYPVAHMTWERKEGSARGIGEVKPIIPNQIEVNRTEMRRILTAKTEAYPHKVVDISKVANPSALNTVGGMIKTNGMPVDDINKIVGTIQPAQMSPDVKLLLDDLIGITRELAGAGETATGEVDPESASGRAILAVQQAAQQPMTEQKDKTKSLVDDIAKIDYDYLVVYSEDGVELEDTVTDPYTGEEVIQAVNVPQTVLQQLKAHIKVEVTPCGVYDRYAKELSLENMLLNGMFHVNRLSELEIYVKLLPNNSVAPKHELEEACKYMREQQRKIAEIQAQSQIMQQRAQQFLMEDPDGQADQMADAYRQLQAEEAMYAEQEAALDEETAAEEAAMNEE